MAASPSLRSTQKASSFDEIANVGVRSADSSAADSTASSQDLVYQDSVDPMASSQEELGIKEGVGSKEESGGISVEAVAFHAQPNPTTLLGNTAPSEEIASPNQKTVESQQAAATSELSLQANEPGLVSMEPPVDAAQTNTSSTSTQTPVVSAEATPKSATVALELTSEEPAEPAMITEQPVEIAQETSKAEKAEHELAPPTSQEIKEQETKEKVVAPAASIASQPIIPQPLTSPSPVAPAVVPEMPLGEVSASKESREMASSHAISAKNEAKDVLEQPAEVATPSPENSNRKPLLMASIPSPSKASPQGNFATSGDFVYPDKEDGLSDSQKQKSLEATLTKLGKDANRPWHDPDVLLEQLKPLETAKPTADWAKKVSQAIQALNCAMTDKSSEIDRELETLESLSQQSPILLSVVDDLSTRRKLSKAHFALKRRLDAWKAIAQLVQTPANNGNATDARNAFQAADPERLSACLTEVDGLMGNSSEAQAWRDFLLVDALKQRVMEGSARDNQLMRQTAQQSWMRLSQTPLALSQRHFLTSDPMMKLRKELRSWAAEPISMGGLLTDIEHYEQTGSPSDARRLALDCQYLNASSDENRRLVAQTIDPHYRNANLRIAISEELLNKLIPERGLEYAPVNDKVLGRQVYGESLMASELAVRLAPHPQRVRMILEVKGEIASLTTADAGPAKFVNDSQANYTARKPLEIDMQGIHDERVAVNVTNETRVRNVETGLDGIPLIGSLAKSVARSQYEMSSSAASEEVKQKIATQARRRVDAEVQQQLGAVVDQLNREVFNPLESLALEPELISGETTDKRFIMRIRLAGDDQLGSHTPRPEAYSDSLASVQIHESMLNNFLQRLELDGRTFTIPELLKHITSRFHKAKFNEINPDIEEATITFAAQNAVTVHCRDGRVEINIAIAELALQPRKWKDFQVRVFYKPEFHGCAAELKRDGTVQLPDAHLSVHKLIPLLGIFNKVFAENAPWQLIPDRIAKEPKLSDASITQFVIDDGWIGISLGPKRDAPRTAGRRRAETAQ
jgi:hypothetical protein